ncbi:tRNA (adenosine(37)-N6)-threonylcarbamoyltransferase complex dimerization subunit type 1 TsaB [Paludibacterium yongneupense]|uniref:tRNA (adenosine(37)-N6)-threonylcarbamoyltransferase complex dimerization subunit type 1 TsaB n=1 Tax=Paludibacterium yongneupense TaxID=400061 RepID=UPI0004172A66|nr:tRNA (adenosine(37)-N6)-threonylcarbamoyltransferase complex dimerization subunit type 1 TsaB [Paludibacterium yongneupense]
MKCLAIDTSTDFLSLAIHDGERHHVFHEQVGQKHAERTLPEIRRLLDTAGIGLDALDAIVFGQGPGSFTGVRIACGIAQGLAFASDLPVIGIPTLDAVAVQAPPGRVWVCLDARMQQVYAASYDTRSWRRDAAIEVGAAAEIDAPAGEEWFGAGDGFALYGESLNLRLAGRLTAVDATLRPHALALLQLAATDRYPQRHPRDAELLYIRNKVALTSLEQQARRQC